MSFPRINKQAKGIAALYTWLGLISIPVLTIVTVISVANVFVRGQLAQGSFIETFWAVIFAAAIEVNIVRLFFEAKLHDDRGSFWLGIILIFVAGIALTIEGLQQSIGFNWTDSHVQIGLGFVVSLRVLVVVVLLAREGSRLASMIDETERETFPPLYACLVHFPDPDAPALGTPLYACLVHFPEPETEQETERFTEQETERETEQNITVFPHRIRPKSGRIPLQPHERKAITLRNKYPDLSLQEIAQKIGKSKTTVSSILKRHAHLLVAQEA